MAAIRPAHPSDLPALYRICLLTGASGTDASDLFADPELLGHFYAGPYAVLEPALSFVATLAGTPVGYILGTSDSRRFARRCEAEWFPVLRERYPLPDPADQRHDAQLVRLIHAGIGLDEPLLELYPAHLHIDLLPVAQGQGLGRRLIEMLCAQLTAQGVPGLHLSVASTNQQAIGFYQRLGFQTLQSHPSALSMGLTLGS